MFTKESLMGTLKRFGKVRLIVYGGDHGRIHFHLEGPDLRCSLDLETLEVLAGEAPPHILRLVRDWIKENRQVVETAWQEWNA